jgi:hypothetical protein
MNRLDPSLVSIQMIEELANSDDHAKRMAASVLLWDCAEVAPGYVPIGRLGRLARPSGEDWYVQAPAMAATKQLLRRRRAARIVFDALAASSDSDDRYAVAAALEDVASVDAFAVPRDLAEQLARDRDPRVAVKAAKLVDALPESPKEARDPGSPFGLLSSPSTVGPELAERRLDRSTRAVDLVPRITALLPDAEVSLEESPVGLGLEVHVRSYKKLPEAILERLGQWLPRLTSTCPWEPS